MKKQALIIVLFLLSAQSAYASEIFGKISTNPEAPNKTDAQADENTYVEPKEVLEQKGDNGSGWVYQNKPASGSLIAENTEEQDLTADIGEADKQKEKIIVLGISKYADGTLLKDSLRKIFLIKGAFKKQLANLKELEKYRGRKIYLAAEEELSQYQTRGHLDGELIREKGDVKVYYIEQGKKLHILNLAELRAKFLGREIHNISRAEIGLY
jgi:hypothetical protein